MQNPLQTIENIKFIITYINENFIEYDYNGNTSWNDALVSHLLKVFLFTKNRSYYTEDDIANATPQQINNLANYIRNYTGNKVGLQEFFHSPHAVKILENNTQYGNLNVYLTECLACISGGNKIASIILMRCCVEELMAMQGCEKYNLGNKITEFINGIERNKDFAIFTQCNKQEEVKILLDVVKDLGNDAVHTNGKSLQEIASKYEARALLKLFCILIEHSTMKEEIQSENNKHIRLMVESINFQPKEVPLEVENRNMITEDDIPF